MTTDAIRTRLYNKKLLDYGSLRTKWLDYMLTEFRGLHGDAYSSDGVLASVAATVTPAATANKINIAPVSALKGVTGNGKKISVLGGDSRLQNVWIPPDAGVVYHVGLEQNDVEDGVEVNPRTGEYEYSQYKEALGRVSNPDSVVDNGNGTLTITVNGLCESGKDYSGRTVRVWLTSRADGGIGPLSPTASVAFQDINITYSAPNNTILVPNLLGQTAASTTASNYKVMLNGPTVKRLGAEDLRNTAGCLFLAAVTSVALSSMIVSCDTTDQTVISQSLAQMGAAIAAQSQATGITYAGGGTWADGTTNPSTTVEAQLDKIISDLAPTTGGAKIGGAATAEIAAGTLNAQIADLALNWGKLSRANTWALLQTFSSGITLANNQNINLSGTGHVVQGTQTIRIATNTKCAAFVGGASPANVNGESFGTGSTAAGRWVHPLSQWNSLWRLTAARVYLPNTIVGAGGTLTLQEHRGSSHSNIIQYTFAGGESGLVSLGSITAATHPYPLVLEMDLTVGSTTTALVAFIELDYDIQ